MSMNKLSERGGISSMSIAFIVVCVALVVAIIFGFSSYSNENKYKNNDTQMINQAVSLAKQKLSAQLNAQFQAQNNATVTSYTGPSQYGSVVLSYPKAWSGYVDTTGGNPIDGYFNPGIVPSVGDQGNLFALRLEVVANTYNSQLAQYTNQQGTPLTITPYALKRVPQIVGVMISGQIEQNKQGVMVILPLRTDTLEIWTESTQYTSLFINQILPAVTFQP